MSRKKVDISELNLKKIGDRITLFRLEKGLSQEEFGNYIGITKGNVSCFESHKYEPSFQVLVKIIEQFKINIDWLMTGEGDMLRKNEKDTYIYNDEDPEIAELLEGARKVLKSGNKVAFEALERNIRYFFHAVSVEEKLENIKEDFQAQISELKSEIKNIKVQRQNNRIREEDRPDDGAKIIKQRVM